MTRMTPMDGAGSPGDAWAGDHEGEPGAPVARPSGRDGIPEAGWAGVVFGLGATAVTMGWAWSLLWGHAA